MLYSTGLILLAGLAAGRLMQKLNLPALTGMLAAGILLGPFALDLISPDFLEISGFLRKVALLVILMRAGLNLKLSDLKRAGRPALLLCFVPASFEILGYVLLGPVVFGLSLAESAVLGCVIAAVSPAVVVPGMVKVMESGYGQDKAVAPMILAGASADDIFVIVLFGICLSLVQGGPFQWSMLLRIPTSVSLGVLGGWLLGLGLDWLFDRLQTPVIPRLLVLLATGLLLYALEEGLTGAIGFSGLVAVMACCLTCSARDPEGAREVSSACGSLWTGAQIFLFVLIGAAINLPYAFRALGPALLILAGGLLFRTFGVLLCTLGTSLNGKERLFCVVAYLPKATVQAAIGAIPLSLGLACGQTVLTMAVLAILITAPAGALLIDRLFPKLLTGCRD